MPIENIKSSEVIIPIEKFVTREEFERVLAELRQRPEVTPVIPSPAKEKVEILSF
jgi:hypothetical protein